MPNMSKTSRSIQSAPGQSGTAEGRVGSGSSTPDLDDEPLGRVEVQQDVVDLEPGAGSRPGIAEVVGAPQLGEQREAALRPSESASTSSSRAGGTKSRRLSRNGRRSRSRRRPRLRGQGRQGAGVRVGRVGARRRRAHASRSSRCGGAAARSPVTWSRRRRAAAAPPGRR